jgi:hypothetical protein
MKFRLALCTQRENSQLNTILIMDPNHLPKRETKSSNDGGNGTSNVPFRTNNEPGITPWNYNPAPFAVPPAAETAGFGLVGNRRVYTLCDHDQPEPEPTPATGPITIDMTGIGKHMHEFYMEQPQLMAYLRSLRANLPDPEFDALLGIAHSIANRLAREGKRVEGLQPQHFEIATHFADEVVFTGPIVCICRLRHRRELRRMWQKLDRYGDGCDKHLLFRHFYILLEVFEHVAVQGNAPVFNPRIIEEEPPKEPQIPLVAEIERTLKATPHRTLVALEKVHDLGYQPTGREIRITTDATEAAAFTVYELASNDSPAKPVEFCYIYSTELKLGFVMNKPFKHYQGLVGDRRPESPPVAPSIWINE